MTSTKGSEDEKSDIYEEDEEKEEIVEGFSKRRSRKKEIIDDGMDSEVEPSNIEEDDDDMFGASARDASIFNKDMSDLDELSDQIADDSGHDSAGEEPIEPFNLKNDLENGRFDDQGNYISIVDDKEEEEQDAWLKDISAKDIKAAAAAQKKQHEQVEAETSPQASSKQDVVECLVQLLEPSETPLEALQRLYQGTKNKKSKLKNRNKQTIDTITTCCQTLLNTFNVAEVYDTLREEFMRMVKSRKRAREDEGTWEFRWISDPDTIHGPYEEETIISWIREGHFSGNAEVRRTGSEESFTRYELIFDAD